MSSSTRSTSEACMGMIVSAVSCFEQSTTVLLEPLVALKRACAPKRVKPQPRPSPKAPT
ncbi:MAG: hypothetical protein QM820_05050 [Minicystis sp.]